MFRNRIESEPDMVKRPSNRAQRVGVEIRKLLADLIHKSINDPRLAQATITEVTVNRDLRIAKVYVAAPGGLPDSQVVLAGFESAKGYLKRELAATLGLRYMPDLKFFYDTSFDYGAHINQVLKSIRTDDEEDTPAADK